MHFTHLHNESLKVDNKKRTQKKVLSSLIKKKCSESSIKARIFDKKRKKEIK